MFFNFFVCSILCVVIGEVQFLYGYDYGEGVECTIENEKINGTCSSIPNCPWALDRIKQRQHIDVCTFNGKYPIVCCPLNERVVPDQSNSSVDSVIPKVRKEYSPADWSKKKCEEYYPLLQNLIIGAGGKLSAEKEFPHMAILGYGDENEKKWACGGSLISFQHILTAAHCVESIDLGEVKYVLLGVLNIKFDVDRTHVQKFNVKKIISHPDFDHSTLKHDIAILVLDKPVTITNYVQPACLYAGGSLEDNAYITATGWGITKFAGEPSSHLIKVELKIVNNTECKYQYGRVGKKGFIDEEIQICAGSAHVGKIIDTCEGDSGGPLQYKSFRNREHHVIIGVTSFGKVACGLSKSAGVYTRVSAYLPWIQSIVENVV